MTDNDWAAMIDGQRERLGELEKKKEEAIGQLADAAPAIREQVLGQIDSEIAQTREAIDNFQWMQGRS